jgi:ATP-dependent DNA ligase
MKRFVAIIGLTTTIAQAGVCSVNGDTIIIAHGCTGDIKTAISVGLARYNPQPKQVVSTDIMHDIRPHVFSPQPARKADPRDLADWWHEPKYDR